ncbi:uncharacterized protein K02A2.6-like [Anneissia japonica]|uniref:uncharacterized protein K02A2.6-like n=1 Tax=Anneissia japonica TaxID=1529436 RepID=UPI001425512B|nr:uncharacterized protein K02A2.6-like [Anneissia japonica]
MPGEKFIIKLADNATPFCVSTPRKIPFAYTDKLKIELTLLETQGIIKNTIEHSDWCAPIVITPKKNTNKIRILLSIGYVLMQLHSDGTWKTVQAGSRHLSDTETRYAVIELELLGVEWAAQKCYNFLEGLPKWIKGKEKLRADALSRHPHEPPNTSDELAEQPIVNGDHVDEAPTISAIRSVADSPKDDQTRLFQVWKSSNTENQYQELKRLIINGFPESKKDLPDHLKKYWCVHPDLSVDQDLIVYGCRLLIPTSLCQTIMQKFHHGHPGIRRAQDRARMIVYWPGIDTDIEACINDCQFCQDHLSMNSKEQLIQKLKPSRPFQEIAADLHTLTVKTT